MLVVGLTGGIASGKTFITKRLKALGYLIHESDKVVGELYDSPDRKFKNFLFKSGFKESLVKNKINKIYLRETIFSNKEKKTILENYLHKEVKKRRDIFLRKNKNKNIVFLDIPLLFEKKLEKICNHVCSAIAPLYLRKKRALRRRGMNKEILEKIISSQIKDKERKNKSDYIIDTSKTIKNTYLQIDSIIYDILYKTKK